MVKDIPGIFLGQSHGHAEFLLYKCVQKPPRKISKTVGTSRRNFCLVLGHVLMLSTDSPTDKNRGKDYCISDLLMIYYRKRETSAANRCLPDGPIDGLPDYMLTDLAVTLVGGGYFCVLLLSLRPMAYPRPNAVSTRLITAMSPSIVNISIALLSFDSVSGLYVVGGTRPSAEGKPPTILVHLMKILP